jgi:pimeloyl-ACP methyl ester carboxylesterase
VIDGLDVPVVEYVTGALPGLDPSPAVAAPAAAAEAAIRSSELPAVVVAHSMGSMPAEVLFRREVPGLLGVVLVDPSAKPTPSSFASWLGGIAESLGDLVARLPAAVTKWIGRRIRYTSVRTDAHARDPLTPAQIDEEDGRPDALAAAIRGYGRYYRWATELPAYRDGRMPRIPVRMLIAADSSGRSLRSQRWLADQLAAVTEVVPETRHLIYLDRPDAIIEAVRAAAGGAGGRWTAAGSRA